jgi:hypothetical protein
MKKLRNFLNEYGMVIIVPLIFIMFFRTCSTNSKIEQLSVVNKKAIDSNAVAIEKINKTIKIEGLKTENRFIQATDRKLLDVNRQSDNEKEINKLENK